MAKRVTATYSGEDVQVEFSGWLSFVSDNPSEGCVEYITIQDVKICDVSCELRDLSYPLRKALFDRSSELDWDTE